MSLKRHLTSPHICEVIQRIYGVEAKIIHRKIGSTNATGSASVDVAN